MGRSPTDMLAVVDHELLAGVEVKAAPALHNDAVQYKAGRFRLKNKPLPFDGNIVDMRLVGLAGEPHRQAASLSATLSRNVLDSECHFVLLGPSGCGKTRADFDVARNVLSMYIECSDPNDERRSSTTDKVFQSLVSELRLMRTKANDGEFRELANQRVTAHLLGRLLALRLLLKAHPSLTPEQYLLAQINGLQEVELRVCNRLALEREQDLLVVCSEVLYELKAKGFKCVVLDEASLGQSLFERVWESPVSKSPRGLSSAFLHRFSSWGVSTITSGTALAIADAETFQADIGKPDSTKVVTQFPHKSEKDVCALVGALLDMNGCDLSGVEDISLLAGRARFGSQLTQKIVQIEESALQRVPIPSKQEVVVEAVNATMCEARDKLSERLVRKAEDNPGSLIFRSFPTSCLVIVLAC
jgi:hypothetical protein